MARHGLRLQDDEHVILDVIPSAFWTLGRYVFTLGLWTFWRKRHRWVLTDHRIIALKGIISRHEQAVPLERIQDVVTATSPFSGGKVKLSTAGGQLGIASIGPLTRQTAYDVADAIVAAQKALRATPVSV